MSWHKRPNILAVEHATDHGLDFRDGRFMLDVTYTVDDETRERIRQGYICLNCTEVFEEAFPDMCNACGYAVKECQAEEFARRYMGEERIGPKVKVADEITRLEELMDYEWRHGIVLPDSVKFPNERRDL